MADYKEISDAEHRDRTVRMWEAEKASRPQSTTNTMNYGIRKWQVWHTSCARPVEGMLQTHTP